MKTHSDTCSWKNETTKRRENGGESDKKDVLIVTKSKQSKDNRKGSPTNNSLDGNYGLRPAERREDMPRTSFGVGEIKVCLYMKTKINEHKYVLGVY